MRRFGVIKLSGSNMEKSIGLGDTIEKFTKFSGIKPLVTILNNGEECTPCKNRKKELNNPDLLVNKIFYKKQ